MRDVRILPAVATEVALAANWYEREGYSGLGDKFEAAYYSWVEHLITNGEIYRTVYSGFRRIYLKPFPYALYYRCQADLVIVVLVIHAAWNPDRVQELLQKRGT